MDDVGDRWAIAKIGAGNSNGVVTVTTVNSSTSFTVNAYNQPVDGSTVAFFSSTDRVMVVAVVDGTPTGSAGAWTFSVDRSLPGVSAGDYVMPACEQGETYAEDFMASVALLAPARRRPTPACCRAPTGTEEHRGFPSALTTTQLVGLQVAHVEITNAAYFAGTPRSA